ncbi:MAG: sigma-70 family RNA polymerase sigma factor [Verrucomicrobiota bacterium]|jgi:RNA polymerase sigma-70 factor (ECF subfamily)|nr:sigma-70 family RNA polymerase sigma factor [Verrucomicrobiota bacterium]
MSTLAIEYSDGTALGSVTEDQSVLERIRNGEEEAFEEIVVRYQKRVFGILCRYERDHQKVEDLVQETFLKAWRGLARYRAKSPFEHWISRIASNVARDHLRRIQRRIRETSFEDMGGSALDWLSVGNTNKELDIHEARQLLNCAMQALTELNQQVVILREIKGLSLKEVSQITGLTTANVKIRSHRAKAKMREALEELLDMEDRNGAVAPAEAIQPKLDWQPDLEIAPMAA